MKEIVDRLSRDLALGVSRRKALWMFLAGSGALGLTAEKKAMASPRGPEFLCAEDCTRQAQAFLDMCLSASENGPSGYCPEFTILKVNSTQIRVNGTPLAINGGQVFLLEETYTRCR